MTYGERNQIVKLAQAYMGIKKGSEKHKEILAIYNKAVKDAATRSGYEPEPRGHQMQVNEAWCATFASVMGLLAGAKEYPLECSCGQCIKQLKAKGNWEENDAFSPNPADLIFYDWEDSGKGDCTGAPNHVGIVEKVASGKITVIEGNKDGKVARRSISINGRYIRGFGRMKVEEDPVIETKKESDTKMSVAYSYAGIVNAKTGLNVRKGPGTGYAKIGALKYGMSVVIQTESAGWGKITYEGKEGWVCLEYIRK